VEVLTMNPETAELVKWLVINAGAPLIVFGLLCWVVVHLLDALKAKWGKRGE